MKKTLQTWNLAFMAICGIFGTLIGIAIIYFTTGKFDISILLGALTAATIFIVINIVKEFKKKDNLPETDERIRKNIMKYFLISSHIFIGVLFVALGVITFLGVESVSLTYLWIIIIAYLWVSGIGGFIASRR